MFCVCYFLRRFLSRLCCAQRLGLHVAHTPVCHETYLFKLIDRGEAKIKIFTIFSHQEQRKKRKNEHGKWPFWLIEYYIYDEAYTPPKQVKRDVQQLVPLTPKMCTCDGKRNKTGRGVTGTQGASLQQDKQHLFRYSTIGVAISLWEMYITANPGGKNYGHRSGHEIKRCFCVMPLRIQIFFRGIFYLVERERK